MTGRCFVGTIPARLRSWLRVGRENLCELDFRGSATVPVAPSQRLADWLRPGSRAAFILFACALFLSGVATNSSAQVSAAGGWSTTTETFPPPHANRKKTVFSGLEANPQADGTLLIKQLKIDTFHENGDGEMTFEAPDCVLDQRTHAAGSPGPLQIHSADGKLRISGTGFLWRQSATNSSLTISNNIETTLQRELLAQSAATGTAATNSATNSPPGTNQPVHISSDEFFFDRNANTIIYRHNVHVDDDQMTLNCDVLTIQRTTNGAIQNITADRNVVIVNKGNGGRTTGDHAVYTATGDVQLVTLTGNPHLQNGAQEGTAKTFVFDRTHHTFQMVGDAFLKLPRDTLGDSGFMLTTPSASIKNTPTNTPNGITNFVDIYSDTMTFQLPPTNGPVISITAETNVRIFDPEKQSHASGDRAVFTDATGALELIGKALWEADGGRQAARGELLTFDRNSHDFSAHTNAYLKFPVAALGPSTAIGSPGPTNTARSTNQFIEVIADSYDYRNDSLVFRGPVKAGLVEGETIVGTLNCAALTVGFINSNVLQSVVADGDVYARQLPATNSSGKIIEKDLRCDHLEVQMRTNGLVRDITALRNVTVTQTEIGTNSAKPVVVMMNSETLAAFFKPDTSTNVVDNIVAERNVVITRDDGIAHGAKVVYTATNNLATLTGDPSMESAKGWLTAEDAIVYDRTTGRIKGVGNPYFKSKPGALVKTNLPSATAPPVR